jgi:outer membrane protein OmpA-like peptidoglycan-associated protein
MARLLGADRRNDQPERSSRQESATESPQISNKQLKRKDTSMKRVLITMVVLTLVSILPCFAETQEEFERLKAQEESLQLIPKGKFKVIPKNIIIEGLRADDEFTFHNENVLFQYGQARIREECLPQLDQIAQALQAAFKDPELSKIQTYYVDGHTCNIGSFENNCRLSWSRSQAAIEELVKRGVPRQRLASRGFSYSVPTRANDTEENRQANRRVVIASVSEKTAQKTTVQPCQQTQPSTSRTPTETTEPPVVVPGVREETDEDLEEEKGTGKKRLPPGFKRKTPEQPIAPKDTPRTLPPGFKRSN